MKTIDKRTKGEFQVGYGHNSNCLGIFTKNMLENGLEESPICLISPIEKMNVTDRANADFIVKACNNYDALVKNLERILDRIKENDLQDAFPYSYNKAQDLLNQLNESE